MVVGREPQGVGVLETEVVAEVEEPAVASVGQKAEGLALEAEGEHPRPRLVAHPPVVEHGVAGVEPVLAGELQGPVVAGDVHPEGVEGDVAQLHPVGVLARPALDEVVPPEGPADLEVRDPLLGLLGLLGVLLRVLHVRRVVLAVLRVVGLDGLLGLLDPLHLRRRCRRGRVAGGRVACGLGRGLGVRLLHRRRVGGGLGRGRGARGRLRCRGGILVRPRRPGGGEGEDEHERGTPPCRGHHLPPAPAVVPQRGCRCSRRRRPSRAPCPRRRRPSRRPASDGRRRRPWRCPSGRPSCGWRR